MFVCMYVLYIVTLFPIAVAIGSWDMLLHDCVAFFMTSWQPFSCVPTCADQYIIVEKHDIGQYT